MLKNFDLNALRKIPEIGYYFRYPLRPGDFHNLRLQDQDLGDYAAKPLYDSLTPDKRVDRSSGYNGDIASIFVPSQARSVRDVSLLLTHVAPLDILLPSGRRNWLTIRAAARTATLQMLEMTPAVQDYRVIPLTIGPP